MVELIEGILLSFGLAADDDERGIDVIDGDDIPIDKTILEEGPYVLILLVLLQDTAPAWEQPLTHLSPYLQLSLLALTTQIKFDRRVLRHYSIRV